MVFATKTATAGKAEIGMRPEFPSQASVPAAGGSGRRPGQAPTDHIYITLPLGPEGAADPAALGALEEAVDRVAREHGLARESRAGTRGLVRFDYQLGEQRTHAIHIVTPLTGRILPNAQALRARLAIIIDDLGYERAAADALFALPFPLTVAVLPHLPYSADIAEEAHRRGYQVMLHLPMESSNGARSEAIELRATMNPAEVTRSLAGMLETVPHAAGVNNHQGSLATADARLMAELMPALRERNLFFVDSRTTPASVAYEFARRVGVPTANRDVFLDDTPTPEAVRQQLMLAVRLARVHRFAIAIGHPHPATLQVLEESLPQLESQGIGLVFASQLVQ